MTPTPPRPGEGRPVRVNEKTGRAWPDSIRETRLWLLPVVRNPWNQLSAVSFQPSAQPG